MSDPLERNLEILVRAGALPLIPQGRERARRAFLRQVGSPEARPGPQIWGRLALAAGLAICAGGVGVLFQNGLLIPPRNPLKMDLSSAPSPGAPPESPGAMLPPTPSDVTLRSAIPFPIEVGGEDLTLRVVPVYEGERLSRLDLEGRSPLPASSMLLISLNRVEEAWSEGRLEPKTSLAKSAQAEVLEGRFVFEEALKGPGLYEVEVLLMPEFQTPRMAARIHPQQWKLPLAAWGDELIPKLSPRLRESDALAQEALRAIEEVERATQSEAAWKNASRTLLGQTANLMTKILQSEPMKLYPASLGQVYFTLRSLAGAAPFFAWKDGAYDGPRSYHAPEQKLRTHRQEAFTFANLKRYVAESVPVAGREMALWLVKDIRRGGPPAGHRNALERESQHPGLAPFAERLGRASFEDLPGLEKGIRERS